MNDTKFIPNKDQRDHILKLFKDKYPRDRILIINNGMVVARAPGFKSNFKGQIVKIKKMLYAISLDIDDHQILYEGLVIPEETQVENLQRRIEILEKKLDGNV